MQYFIDTLLEGVKSLMGNRGDQLFTDGEYI